MWDGAPFTGIIYANHPDGVLELEYNNAEGLPSGIQRQWYRGKGSVWSRRWHPNGVLKYERTNDQNGLASRIREWSEDGRLLSDTAERRG